MTAGAEPKKVGAPSIYNADLATEFCARIMSGRSVVSVCKDEDMPCEHTIYRWQNLNREFSQNLARARADRAASISDRMVDLATQALDKADRTDPARLRAAVDALDKAARIMQPRKIELSGPAGGPLQTQTVALDPERLKAMTPDELAALEKALGRLQRGDSGGASREDGSVGADAYAGTLDGGEG